MSNIDVFEYPWLPAEDSHDVACCICNGVNPTRSVHALTINGKEFEIRQCETDDLLFLSPQPGTQYAEALYNHESYFGEVNDAYGHFVTKESGMTTGEYRLRELTERKIQPANFLEIGCGLGYTLEVFAKAGIKTTGIEFSAESVAHGNERGLDVHLGTVEEPIPANVAAGQSYDAIALYSVLEHVPNPVSFLERLTPLLSPEGTLIIRVPRMSAEGPWVSLLDHYWHFTPESLQRALEMQGFTLYDSYPSGAFVDTKGMVLESMTVLAKRSI